MSALLIAGLLMAQTSSITVEATRDAADIGFRELAAGHPTEAIKRIDANRAEDANDPAALINRGSALARLGDRDSARASFTAALSSRERYDVELSDGRWLDSRSAARLAIRMLKDNTVLALK